MESRRFENAPFFVVNITECVLKWYCYTPCSLSYGSHTLETRVCCPPRFVGNLFGTDKNRVLSPGLHHPVRHASTNLVTILQRQKGFYLRQTKSVVYVIKAFFIIKVNNIYCVNIHCYHFLEDE